MSLNENVWDMFEQGKELWRDVWKNFWESCQSPLDYGFQTLLFPFAVCCLSLFAVLALPVFFLGLLVKKIVERKPS